MVLALENKPWGFGCEYGKSKEIPTKITDEPTLKRSLQTWLEFPTFIMKY